MMVRRFGVLVTTGFLLTMLVACGSENSGSSAATTTTVGAGAGTTAVPGGSDGVLLVGSIASETGSAQPYGLSQRNGTELGLDRLTGAGLAAELLAEDDTSTPDGGTAAMRSLVDAGASAVLGPTLSPVAVAADPLAQRAGIPVLAVTNTTLDIAAIGDVVWRVSLSEEALIPQAVAAAKAQGSVATAALVYDATDDYARGAAEAFRAGAVSEGVELVADVAYDPVSADAAGILGRATASAPDALFLAARSAPAIDLLLAAHQLGLPQVKVGGNGFNSAEVLASAGPAAEGLIVAASWNIGSTDAASIAFVEAYRGRFGVDPDAFAAQAYGGMEVLLAAVEVGGGTTPAQVRAGLADLGEIPTVLGSLHFSAREAVYPADVQVVRGGSFVLL